MREYNYSNFGEKYFWQGYREMTGDSSHVEVRWAAGSCGCSGVRGRWAGPARCGGGMDSTLVCKDQVLLWNSWVWYPGPPSLGNLGLSLPEGRGVRSTRLASSPHRTVPRCPLPRLPPVLPVKWPSPTRASSVGNCWTVTRSDWELGKRSVLQVFLWFHLCYCGYHDVAHFYCWAAFRCTNTSQFTPLLKGTWAASSFRRLWTKRLSTLLQTASSGRTVSFLWDKMIIRSGMASLQGRYMFDFF